MRLFLRLILLGSPFLLFSCKKYKSSDAAFFIRTEKVALSTDYATQGSGSNNITDLWLYVNGQFEGTYPIGNLMPILLKDNHAKISVYAGIKNNGIAKTRIFWELYDRIDLDTAVEAGKTITRNFTFKYNAATVFTLTENFDGQGVKIIKSENISEVPYTTVSSVDNFEGKSLKLELSSIHDSIAQVETSDPYSLPTGTGNLYAEFDYKCNNEFSVGLIGDDGALRPVSYMNATDSWNHIYVALATQANYPPVSSAYKLYFRMLRTDGNTGDLKMFLDNIKIVYIP